jgi:uncharacterized membrane protein
MVRTEGWVRIWAVELIWFVVAVTVAEAFVGAVTVVVVVIAVVVVKEEV